MIAQDITKGQQNQALTASTLAFTVCFAVWTIFSIIGLKIKADLGLNDTQFGILVATPILTGSLSRIFLGIWTNQYGGKRIFTLLMMVTSISVWMLSTVSTYPLFLLSALGVGLAGGGFAVGVSYVSRWYDKDHQGTALGIFGMGNVGSAITSFVAPFLVVAVGWEQAAQVYSAVLFITAVLFFMFTKEDPATRKRRDLGNAPASVWAQLTPLKKLQVWRFSLYYFFVFGAFVALALWLPRYYVGAYNLDITTAGMLTAAFALSGSIFRAYGGWLSDKWGARSVIYWTFFGSAVICFILSYPATSYTVDGIEGPITFDFAINLTTFVSLTVVLGFFMSLGKAAVYKHIPLYYPENVGSVGGMVGMIGGLGGFILPITFGIMNDLIGVWTACFMLLFLLVSIAFVWMHAAIRLMERDRIPELANLPQFPEMEELHTEDTIEENKATLKVWTPEDKDFWAKTGKGIATRNLWISIPALLLAFSVWLVWSVVVAKLNLIGFDFTMNQLFWLAALPGLSGAMLRVFYSFMVPIFGGRMWTAFSTATLLLPAVGIGFAVQNPDTSYAMFVLLAFLCGLGGGNFASSMANISFFYPKAQKGNALGLNAGLGNLGVSVMQFVVPLVITMGVFGAIGGSAQVLADGSEIWLQNAGFIWVPFIITSSIAAWLGMNNIEDAKASVSDQVVIFKRKHNWIMCWLYTGTFGSFIGYSAGFPLLATSQFPEVDALKFAFIGPLLGALSRAATGWVSDKFGGGRVTLWTFVVMIIGVLGILYFLGIKEQDGTFWGFFASFMLLFFATGVGNASTFQMIPIIFSKECSRIMAGQSQRDIRKQAERESAATIGFTSAIAAYGAFFIPKSYGTSISMTGGPELALQAFAIFYVSCLAVTWWYYIRKNAEISC